MSKRPIVEGEVVGSRLPRPRCQPAGGRSKRLTAHSARPSRSEVNRGSRPDRAVHRSVVVDPPLTPAEMRRVLPPSATRPNHWIGPGASTSCGTSTAARDRGPRRRSRAGHADDGLGRRPRKHPPGWEESPAAGRAKCTMRADGRKPGPRSAQSIPRKHRHSIGRAPPARRRARAPWWSGPCVVEFDEEGRGGTNTLPQSPARPTESGCGRLVIGVARGA